MVIQIKRPDIGENIHTSLSEDYTSGTSLSVLSSVGFLNAQYVVIGEPGLENTEVTNLTASPPTNTSLTVTALKFAHPKGTPVTYLNWDQYSLEYRTASTESWNVYGSMPASLVFDAAYTEYRETTSTSTYQWRYRYYSSEKSAYSSYSDTISATGWPRNSVGYMVREIRKIVGDPDGKTVSDTEIIRFLNTAQDKVFSLYDRWYFLLKTGTNIDTIQGRRYYALPSDFGRMKSVAYNYISGSTDITYNLRYLSDVEYEYTYQDNNASNDDELVHYTLYPGDSTNETGYLYVGPEPDTAGLHLTPHYYKKMTDLDSYADETDIPIPDMLENYAIAVILGIRKEDDKAAIYDKAFKEQIELLKLMQRKSARPMRSLWKYQGRKAEDRLYGTQYISGDTEKENYW